MVDTIEFDINLSRARRSVVFFIIATLALISLIALTGNDLSVGASTFTNILLLLLLLYYFGYLAVLSRRLYHAHFKEKPQIVINNESLLIPTYFLGTRQIPIRTIYSMENLSSVGNNEVVILGVTDKSRYFIDELLFSNHEDFQEFKNVLKKLVDRNANVETNSAIMQISFSQEKRATVATFIIFIICVIAYLLSTSLNLDIQDNQELVLLGAGTKNILASGEFYRLFSSSFLHVGVFHLLLNLLVLGIMGELLERVISAIRFINIFLFSSLVAYVSFVLFSNYEMGVGASGGIFGLWGAYFSLKLRHEKFLPGSVNAIPLRRLFWVLVIEFLAEIFLLENVGYEVHLGGFLAGFVYLYFVPLGTNLETVDQPTKTEKYLFALLVSSYTLGLTYFLLL